METDGLVSFAFGDAPEENDRILAQIIDGTRTASVAPKRDLGPGLEPPPVVGQRFVILDGRGAAGAIIEDVSILHCRFKDMPDDLIRACGASDVTGWKSKQAAYLAKYGGWSEDLEMVCDYFRLLAVLDRSTPGSSSC